MTFSHITHHMGKAPGEQSARIVRTTPIVRLGMLAESVYLQGGKAYSAEGGEMELPDWAYGEMGKLTPAVLKEAGFESVPKHPSGVTPSAPTIQPVKQWQCPSCSKLMDDEARPAHVAKHNRHLGALEQLDEWGKPKAAGLIKE